MTRSLAQRLEQATSAAHWRHVAYDFWLRHSGPGGAYMEGFRRGLRFRPRQLDLVRGENSELRDVIRFHHQARADRSKEETATSDRLTRELEHATRELAAAETDRDTAVADRERVRALLSQSVTETADALRELDTLRRDMTGTQVAFSIWMAEVKADRDAAVVEKDSAISICNDALRQLAAMAWNALYSSRSDRCALFRAVIDSPEHGYPLNRWAKIGLDAVEIDVRTMSVIAILWWLGEDISGVGPRR